MTHERIFLACAAIACVWLGACSSGERYEKPDRGVRTPTAVEPSRTARTRTTGVSESPVPLNLTDASASKAFCLPAVFKSMSEVGGKSRELNEFQQWFMTTYSAGAEIDLPGHSDKLQVLADDDHAEIAEWLSGLGFPSVKVEIPSGYEAVGAVFDLRVSWKAKAGERTIYFPKPDHDGDFRYEGVRMVEEFEMFQLSGHEFPLIRISTDLPDWNVYLVKAEESEDPDPAYLPARAKQLLELPRTPYPQPIQFLIFPFVRMAGDVDVSWLSGMSGIGFAEQKIRFQFDAKGRFPDRLYEVVDPKVDTRPVTYLIVKRFYFIFSHAKMTYPAFVALSAPDSWVEF